MNPHYHHGVPYGGGGGGGGGGGAGAGGNSNHPGDHLTSPPHPPPSPPENNNYHHSGGGHHPMAGAHHSNGHSMGPLGHPGNPHDPHSTLIGGHHPHLQQHPAFTGGGGHPGQQHHHHPHLHPHHPINTNNNNNNTGGSGGPGGTIKVCQGCGGKIVERFLLHALDRYWHNGCLKCNCCGAMLAEIGSSCFTKGGMILCKQDYMSSRRLYGNSGACSACGQTIPASEFVMRSGGGSGAAGGGGGPSPQHPGSGPPNTHVFHLKCFACSKCGQPLVSGDRYYMVAANLVCEQDWHKMLKSTATPAVRKGKVGRPRRSRD